MNSAISSMGLFLASIFAAVSRALLLAPSVMPFEDTVDDLTAICQRNGGGKYSDSVGRGRAYDCQAGIPC